MVLRGILVMILGIMLHPAPASAQMRCAALPGGHLGQAVCDQAARLLGTRAVVLEVMRDEPLMLVGRLGWQSGARFIHGPEVAVSATVLPLTAGAAARLAEGLLRVSDLP